MRRNSPRPSASVLTSGQCPRSAAGLHVADLDDARENVRERHELAVCGCVGVLMAPVVAVTVAVRDETA